MIGTKVSLRLRMSAHDAHYAGELVDGARMLALFGDLATELLIRLDGDEGLFRAYETVEFLAPVFAGDYIEAIAELMRNRQHEPRDPLRGPQGHRQPARVRAASPPRAPPSCSSSPSSSAARFGTCVVPKELQRKPRELYMPGLPAGPAPSAHIERMVDAQQRAVALPFDEVVVHGALGRQIPRQLAPLAAGRQHVEDGVQDLAPAFVALRRQVRLDQRPLRVRHIARIACRSTLVVAPVLCRPHASPRKSSRGSYRITTDSLDSTFFRTGFKLP